MHDYSAGVALFDFLPVLLSGLGLLLLARAIAARRCALAPLAWGAALLIIAGGMCKASWKLVVALHGRDIGWLANMLFICLAPGFVVMSFCLFSARRGTGLAPWRLLSWLALTFGGACAAWLFSPHPRAWFFWLLSMTTAASAALIFNAVLIAFRSRQRGIAALFIYHFFANLVLSGLARLPPSETTAWLQEGVNFSSQAAFAYAAWRLSASLRRSWSPLAQQEYV
jgi:hypothetical protein